MHKCKNVLRGLEERSHEEGPTKCTAKGEGEGGAVFALAYLLVKGSLEPLGKVGSLVIWHQVPKI